VIEPLSGLATLKSSKGLIAAVQTCHAQRWRFDFVVGVGAQTNERDGWSTLPAKGPILP
jgi:hypothetical protein